jgi:predicted DNA-binding ribbon-helix-helix protein
VQQFYRCAKRAQDWDFSFAMSDYVSNNVTIFCLMDAQVSSAGCNNWECAVMKRSMVIAGHKTSVSLEDSFWESLREIATAKGMRLGKMVASIDAQRQGNLSSAIRLFVLANYKELAIGSSPRSSADAGTGSDFVQASVTA